MFLKEKYLANGDFVKLKARLVAGGDQQDRNFYEDLSAPTASTCSVFAVLAVAAKENRHSAVIDIRGAFLHASMSGQVQVHMRLDKLMSRMLTELDGQYDQYREKSGCIVVRLDRALYGCVESASLWYDNLTGTLKGLGFEKNLYDQCMFNTVSKTGAQVTVTVHVDDLYVTCCEKQPIDQLANALREK